MLYDRKAYYPIPENFGGVKVAGRFKTIKKLDEGCYGIVFKVVDIKNPELKLAMKVCEQTPPNEFEVTAMTDIHRKSSKGYQEV